MVSRSNLPKNRINGIEVRKISIVGIDVLECIYITPKTSIKLHGHDNQWEVLVKLSNKTAYVCLKREEHEIINKSSEPQLILAIKGHLDYSYEDFVTVFRSLGFSVEHGNLIVDWKFSLWPTQYF